MKKKMNIGLFGYGCVGHGFYKALKQSPNTNAEIKKIVVKDKYKDRDLPPKHFTYQASDILIDTEIDTVVELIDDVDAAYDIVKSALNQGKHVVSANKKLIAEHLDELIALAQNNRVSFLYEASVCASIPIIRNLEDYFRSDHIQGFQGICNGTTNYILTRTNQGLTYKKALQESQSLGYAESDPTLDVDGFDAKYKLIILLKHSFGISTKPEDVFNCGIRPILPEHIAYAEEQNSKIKFFSFAQKIDNKVFGFVAPFLISSEHPIFNVENEFNAVNVEAKFSHQQLFLGKGAGSEPTASAVLSDVSALGNDYKYSYAQSDVQDLNFTNDFYLKIYLASPNQASLEQIPFIATETTHQSDAYHYKTGWVNFQDLFKIDFNKQQDLFFAVISLEFKLDFKALDKTIEEAYVA